VRLRVLLHQQRASQPPCASPTQTASVRVDTACRFCSQVKGLFEKLNVEMVAIELDGIGTALSPFLPSLPTGSRSVEVIGH